MRSMKGIFTASLVLLASALAFGTTSLAQDDEGGGGMPTAKGKGKVTDAINSKLGALFDIGGGVTMLFPRGLPVGESRLVTLKKAKGRPPVNLVSGFKPVGPALDFNGAFNTGRKAMVLSVATKRDPVTAGKRLVLAMEVGTFCEKKNQRYKLKGGLCSGVELHDAYYDAGGKRLVAELQSTGGMRMQFGVVPEGSDE